MNEHKSPIPSMIYNAAVGGHVTNSQQIIDENLNREQNDINQETVGIVPYNSTNPNGMGRVVLKKNDNFKEVVEAQTSGNTIFVIKYDFILTNNVTIPINCVLKFEGGSISADLIKTITFNNTHLIEQKFINVRFSGTIHNETVSGIGMGLDPNAQDNSDILDDLLHILPKSGTELFIEPGYYNIAKRITIPDTQKSFFIKGSGYYNCGLVATNANAGITFNNLLKSDISRIKFYAGDFERTTPFIDVDDGNGTVNVTTFWKCGFVGNKAIHIKFSAYCRFDECTFNNYNNRRDTDSYICFLEGEYGYFNNCYFQDSNNYTGTGNPCMLALKGIHIFVQNCDFCGGIGQAAIRLEKKCRYINVHDTVVMGVTRIIDLCYHTVRDIDIDLQVYDPNKITDKFINVYTIEGDTGISWNLNFVFRPYGTFKTYDEFSEEVVPQLDRNYKVKFIFDTLDKTYRLKLPNNSYSIYCIYPEIGSILVEGATSDPETGIGEYVIMTNSPFNEFTVPIFVGWQHIAYYSVSEAHLENTFGGDFKIVFKCSPGNAIKTKFILEQKGNS